MLRRSSKAQRDATIFFATDVHGSDVCFKKFLAARTFYGATVLILGGDLTGKMVVPIVRAGGSDAYHAVWTGKQIVLETSAEVAMFERRVSDAGYYPHRMSRDEFEESRLDQERREQLFSRLVLQRLEAWLAVAEQKLAGSGVPLYVAPGNDDEPAIDGLLEDATAVTNVEGRLVELPGGYEMISTGFSNPTPWNTPRECSEEALGEKIGAMADLLRDPERAIFNIHVPPHNSTLDVCPAVNPDLSLQTEMGRPVMTCAGSTSVRRSIEAYQPLCSLHGHIHESSGCIRIKRTLAVNPGSEYSEGILRGCRIELQGGKLGSYQLTAG